VSQFLQEMPSVSPNRVRRQQFVRQAEGYLELGMAQHALDVLARYGAPESLPGPACYLRGEALRALQRYEEAATALLRAAEFLPERSTEIGLALGWCYKRIGRIDLAIQSLERALRDDPDHALLHYNLACYWSLDGNKRQALTFLARALELDQNLRDLIADESDFDSVRTDPAFKSLTAVIV
jgi:tetratricopeptide (TPR) repeat protein